MIKVINYSDENNRTGTAVVSIKGLHNALEQAVSGTTAVPLGAMARHCSVRVRVPYRPQILEQFDQGDVV